MYRRSLSGLHHQVAAVKHRSGITRRASLDAGDDDDVMVAGERVPAGRYRRVDVAEGRVIEVAEGDYLPASLDGRVAIYEKLRDPAAGEKVGVQVPYSGGPPNDGNIVRSGT